MSNMDFIKQFAGAQNLDHLGKKPSKSEEAIATLAQQIIDLMSNVQNMRQLLLTFARIMNIEPEALVRALQEVDKNETYVSDLKVSENIIQKEINDSKSHRANDSRRDQSSDANVPASI